MSKVRNSGPMTSMATSPPSSSNHSACGTIVILVGAECPEIRHAEAKPTRDQSPF